MFIRMPTQRGKQAKQNNEWTTQVRLHKRTMPIATGITHSINPTITTRPQRIQTLGDTSKQRKRKEQEEREERKSGGKDDWDATPARTVDQSVSAINYTSST